MPLDKRRPSILLENNWEFELSSAVSWFGLDVVLFSFWKRGGLSRSNFLSME